MPSSPYPLFNKHLVFRLVLKMVRIFTICIPLKLIDFGFKFSFSEIYVESPRFKPKHICSSLLHRNNTFFYTFVEADIQYVLNTHESCYSWFRFQHLHCPLPFSISQCKPIFKRSRHNSFLPSSVEHGSYAKSITLLCQVSEMIAAYQAMFNKQNAMFHHRMSRLGFQKII